MAGTCLEIIVYRHVQVVMLGLTSYVCCVSCRVSRARLQLRGVGRVGRVIICMVSRRVCRIVLRLGCIPIWRVGSVRGVGRLVWLVLVRRIRARVAHRRCSCSWAVAWAHVHKATFHSPPAAGNAPQNVEPAHPHQHAKHATPQLTCT